MSVAQVLDAEVKESSAIIRTEKAESRLSARLQAKDQAFVIVGIAIVIAFTVAIGVIGAIVACLALRDSGVIGKALSHLLTSAC
jgi:3-methyladenine DNA glycosylase Tag